MNTCKHGADHVTIFCRDAFCGFKEDKKRRLPHRVQITLGNKTKDGHEFMISRDKLGNATFHFWKREVGFNDDYEVRLNHKEAKKLRDYLSKIIDFVERK